MGTSNLTPKLEKRFKQRRTWLIVCKVIILVILKTVLAVLVWLRLDWAKPDYAITDWIQERYFFNFWSGAYIVFAGCCLGILEGYLAICACLSSSVRFLVVVCVFSGVCGLFLLGGSACMLSDAFGTPVQYIVDLIWKLIDREDINKYENEKFLDKMYRIVGCCGANGYWDYDTHNTPVPTSCVDRYHATGQIYYGEGCGTAFSSWMQEWSGGLGVLALITVCVEIISICLAVSLIGFLKKSAKMSRMTDEDFANRPLPPKPAGSRSSSQTSEASFLYSNSSPGAPPPLQRRIDSLNVTSSQDLAQYRYNQPPGLQLSNNQFDHNQINQNNQFGHHQIGQPYIQQQQTVQQIHRNSQLMAQLKNAQEQRKSIHETSQQWNHLDGEGIEMEEIDAWDRPQIGQGVRNNAAVNERRASENARQQASYNWRDVNQERMQNSGTPGKQTEETSSYSTDYSSQQNNGSKQVDENKLQYQSEIQSLIKSYHDINGDSRYNESSSDISSSSDEDDDRDKQAHNRRFTGQNYQKVAQDDALGQGYQQSKKNINKPAIKSKPTIGFQPTDKRKEENNTQQSEFRQKAKRNESFKNAVGIKRRSSLMEELRKSSESLHEGFKSLTRTGSGERGMNSRSGSMASINSRRGSGTPLSNKRRTGSMGNILNPTPKGRRKSVVVSKEDGLDNRGSNHSLNNRGASPGLKKRRARSQERINQRVKEDFRSGKNTAIDVLVKGLGPRRTSREKLGPRQGKQSPRNRRKGPTDVEPKQGRPSPRSQRKMSTELESRQGRLSPNPKRKMSKNEEMETNEMDGNKKGSFAKEFVGFYLGRKK